MSIVETGNPRLTVAGPPGFIYALRVLYPAKVVDVISQVCAIVILLERRKYIIGFRAPVDIIENAILQEGFAPVGGDPERSSQGGGSRQHSTGSAGSVRWIISTSRSDE